MSERPVSELSRAEDDILYNAVNGVSKKLGTFTKKKWDFDIGGRVWGGIALPRYLFRMSWGLNNIDKVAMSQEGAEKYEELVTTVMDAICSMDTNKLIEAAELGVELCKETRTPPNSGDPLAIPVAAAMEAISMMTTHRALEENDDFNDPDVWLKQVRYHGMRYLEFSSDLIRAVHGHRMRRWMQDVTDAAADGTKRLADGIKATKLNSSTIMVEVGEDGTVLTIQGVGPEFDEILRKDHYDLIEKKKETVRAAKEALRELDAIL